MKGKTPKEAQPAWDTEKKLSLKRAKSSYQHCKTHYKLKGSSEQ